MKYRVGSVIVQRTFSGRERTVTVQARAADIKDGRPGFNGVLEDGTGAWGYDDQVVRIIKY